MRGDDDDELESPDELRLFLAGDVMTGRGIDQILPRPVEPALREPYVQSARTYVELAEQVSGPVPAPVEPAYVWGDGLSMLREARPDVRIVNLETSITTSSEFWPSKTVHYRMHPENVGCLQAAELDVCVLANNHILDFGHRGLVDTMATLQTAGIDTAGAGRDLGEARRPAIAMVGAHTRVLVAGVGSETSGIPAAWAATGARAGVDVVPDLEERTARELAARVEGHRQAGDIVVVSLHWGSNWGFEISQQMVRFARALVDGGIDVVHGHSSHHVRPIEVYRGKLILYGAGDLITDYEGIRGYEAYRGELGAMVLPVLSSQDGTLRRLTIAPTRMQRLQLASPSPDDAAWLLSTLNRISARFGTRFEPGPNGSLAWAGSPG